MNKALTDLLKEQTAIIITKVAARTGLFAERYFKTPVIQKDPKVIAFENRVNDPNDELYHDGTVLRTWNALNGFKGEQAASFWDGVEVKFDRAVAVVLLDKPGHPWDASLVGQTFVCVHKGNGKFWNAEGESLYIDPEDGLYVRPANDGEIEFVIAGLMKVMPMRIVKTLGDKAAAAFFSGDVAVLDDSDD